MCVPILGEGVPLLFCGVCLENISRESPIFHVFCVCKKQWLPISTGYIFHKIGENEERAKVPLILRKWGGGGGVRGDRNLDNNSDSFDKHVSPLIAFSH